MSPLSPAQIMDYDPVMVSPFSRAGILHQYHASRIAAPTSNAFPNANRAVFAPFHLNRPYLLARWWWLNGASAATDYLTIGIYDELWNLVAASPRVLASGASVQQFTSPGIWGGPITSNSSNTDGTQYTTASVTLKAGRLYLLAVENSKASSADAVSSIDSATSGVPTFTSRSTVQYNTSTANRTSIWSCVPTADWTGALRINFSATQTGAVWALSQFMGVDTTTNDGIVQNVTNTGTAATTATVTLAALGSANNSGFVAHGLGGNLAGAVTSTVIVEHSDTTASTPGQGLQTGWATNTTVLSETMSSTNFGSCAVEIKATTSAIWIPPMRGWLAIHSSGSTTTILRTGTNAIVAHDNYLQSSLPNGFLDVATPASNNGQPGQIHVFGFTNRASP